MRFDEHFYIDNAAVLLPDIRQFGSLRVTHDTPLKNTNKKSKKPLDKLPFSCYNTKAV